jgi:hypothetical protein
MQIIKVKISSLSLNEGQIEGVPANPRIIKDVQYKRLLKSIQEDPEFMTYKPLYVFNDVVVGGNMRLRACQELKWKEVPIIRIPEDTTVKKLKAFIIKDNSHYGENDWEAFANEWSDSPLNDWGAIKSDYESYSPNENPVFDTHDITKDEIEKRAEILANQMIKDKKYMDMICPKCGHEYTTLL